MNNTIKTYILHSPIEKDRIARVNTLRENFKNFTVIESIYPSNTHIPFLHSIIEKSKERTGKALMATEFACLLGHRRILREIVKVATNNQEHFLILESDSKILDLSLLERYFEAVSKQYDFFFWGAWEGNAKIKRSTSSIIQGDKNTTYRIGEPLLNTIYCTYGYSINKPTAEYLLKKTSKISTPYDIFKQFIDPQEIKLGTIVHEIITTTDKDNKGSYIRKTNFIQYLKKAVLIFVLNIRNTIRAYFS
jgi:GR25 family glycosyltransferase involved in LPS biosynthesis